MALSPERATVPSIFRANGWIRLTGLVPACLAVWSGIACQAEAQPAASGTGRPPNVIVVLVDDLGWRDLACQGSLAYETPAVDRLAAEGMRFTRGYAACTVCSPSRAALMTGQYPARLHLTDWIAGHDKPDAKLLPPDWTKHLPLEATTLAERLRAAGYATASIGKWHLGSRRFFPEHQGFDESIGGCDKGHPPSYFSPYGIPTLSDGPEGEYLTDREAAEAVRFITEHREDPFFLYLPHYCVHTPLQGKPDVTARFETQRPPNQSPWKPTYAAMVESVDDALGRILDTLEAHGIRERTAIVFTSDNGGLAWVTDNRPLRAGKGSAYEAGVRVPLIISWPGVTQPGSTTAVPAITPDIPVTILALTGVSPDPDQPLDGRDLSDVLAGGVLDRDALFWHYPHYHPGGATPYSAVLAGTWRLVHFYEDDRDELYDLATDPGETTDLAAAEPERRTALRATLDAWLVETGAQMPVPNPKWNGSD